MHAVGGGALQHRVDVVLERFMAEVGADINEIHAIRSLAKTPIVARPRGSASARRRENPHADSSRAAAYKSPVPPAVKGATAFAQSCIASGIRGRNKSARAVGWVR
jgi:hypothetical protein